MKFVKMLGLLAVLAASLMAYAAPASATSLTSPAGTTYTGKIHAEAEDPNSEGKKGVTLDGPATINCTHSTVEGEVEAHGSEITASGLISALNFTECNQHVTVLKKGELIIHTEYTKEEDGHETQNTASNGNGTLTSNGAEVEVVITALSIKCIYSTSNTDIGTLTGSNTSHATLDIKALIPRTGGSIFCGGPAEWTGSYTVTNPSTLYVH